MIKGFFGGGPKPLDRDELFGESAGKASSSVAKNIAGAGMPSLQVSLYPDFTSLQTRSIKHDLNLQSKGVNSQNEVAKARMAVIERGQRLNELEDRTEQMANEAKQYAATSQSLLNMYKNKKWYQL